MWRYVGIATGLAMGLALALAAVVWLPGLRQATDVGAGYLAKQMCSCLFVAGRPFDACRADMPRDMDAIEVRLADGAETVVARVPLLAERTARHHPGSGCTLY